MKSSILIFPVLLLILMITGCLMEPGNGAGGGQSSAVSSTSSSISSSSASSSSSSAGLIPATLNVEIIDNSLKGIEIGGSSVTQADIIVTGPSGSFQKQLWFKGDTNLLTFLSYESGTHYITVIEYDDSNRILTNSCSSIFTTGYNYYIVIALGGSVILEIGTNH